MGPAHDQQTIWQLFDDFAMISNELSIDDDFTRQVVDAKKRLAGTKIGSDGRIMEWADEFPEAEPGHRHISHLFAIHPGSQINMLQTPDLVEAANKSLDYRIQHRQGYVGWSSAWAISQYARLHQAEKAKKNLDDVIAKCINPNLFTICPPPRLQLQKDNRQNRPNASIRLGDLQKQQHSLSIEQPAKNLNTP